MFIVVAMIIVVCLWLLGCDYSCCDVFIIVTLLFALNGVKTLMPTMNKKLVLLTPLNYALSILKVKKLYINHGTTEVGVIGILLNYKHS